MMPPLPPETLAWFGGDELRARIFYDKYALRNDANQVIETTPLEMWDRIAAGLATVEATDALRHHWTKEFRWLLDSFRFIPGGRIMHAIGNPNKVTALNCYVLYIREDSLHGIFRVAEESAKTHARGGGVGFDISPLRPKGAPVRNAARSSTGAVGFMELFSQETGVIGQGARRGATMLTIADSHPDVLDFCKVKRNRTSVRYANISVRLTDAFMQAVNDDDLWPLFYENRESRVLVKSEIRARELWDELITGAHDWAEPGCLFWDTIQRRGTSQYGGMEVISTNPCVPGDTLVSTTRGLMRIDTLPDTPHLPHAVLDTRVSPSHATGRIVQACHSGRKGILRIDTKAGYTLRATREHKILTGNRDWVEAKALKPGDLLLLQNRPGRFGPYGTAALGRVWGWLIADGYIAITQRGFIPAAPTSAILSFARDKRALTHAFLHDIAAVLDAHNATREPTIRQRPHSQQDQIQSAPLLEALRLCGLNPQDKHALPPAVLQGTQEFLTGFLQSLFTAKGTLSTGTRRHYLRLKSTHLTFLRHLQLLLLQFGIVSTIRPNMRPAGLHALPDHATNQQRLYQTKAVHALIIERSNLQTFEKLIGFLPLSDKQARLQHLLATYTRGPHAEPFTTTVTAVTPDGDADVYDLTELRTHTFIANGLTITNCGEQALEPYGACDLGSINLLNFVQRPFSGIAPEYNINRADLSRAVHTGIRFLDNVLDWNRGRHALPEQEEAALRARRVGLGITGLGDLLIALQLRYGSPEATAFIDRLFHTIKCEAYKASIDLAREKGVFPVFDRDTHLHQPFLSDLPADLQEAIARHGLRNVATMTVPPVGTGAALAGVTSGIEPIFALSYLRRSESLSQEEFLVLHPLAAHYWTQHLQRPLPDAATFEREAKTLLPPFFITAHDLNWQERVATQATIQAHVDNALSSTLNLPRDVTTETVGRLYQAAWKAGVKGISVYREGSREGILLTHDQVARQSQERLTISLTHAVNRLAGPLLPATAKISDPPTSQDLERLTDAIDTLLATNSGQLSLIGTTPPLRPRPRIREGILITQPAPEGNIEVTVATVNGEPFELICHGGKAGSDILAWIQALARTISIFLRLQRLPSQRERLELVIEQLSGIAGSRPLGLGPAKVHSGPDGIAQALQRYLAPPTTDTTTPTNLTRLPAATVDTDAAPTNGNCCPQCRNFTLVIDEGCLRCPCGFKEC